MLTFCTLLLTLPGPVRAGSVILEGILESESGESSAIMNGRIVRPGEKVGDYEVVSVEAEGVQLKHVATAEAVFLAPGEVRDQTTEDISAPAKGSEAPGWWDRMVRKMFPDLTRLGEKVQYAGVIADLKRASVAAMMYYVERGQGNFTLGDLVREGMLPPFFIEGSYGYRYRVFTGNRGVSVSATPAEHPDQRMHFLIDEYSYVYAEEGRPATPRSPRFTGSGYSIEILPQQ